MIIQAMNTPPTHPSLSGVTQLSHLGVIRAVGPDAGSFLQGQLTQDVVNMGPDTARLAAFCNAKGRMQASFVVFKNEHLPKPDDGSQEFLLVCSADLLAQTLKRLTMFVMRAKVKLSDASGDMLLYGLAGDIALDATLSVAASAHITWAKHQFHYQMTVFLPPGAGVQRALWCAPVGTALPAGAVLSMNNWLWLEVQSGIAMVSQPIFEAFVPQMLNYESVGGVSFKKGCYPGQEVVARSQFRGTLKRRAYLVHAADADGQPALGQEVFHSADAEQPCGLVAASAANPSGGYDAVVSMQTSAALAGALSLGSAQGPTLTVLTLPYPLLEDI